MSRSLPEGWHRVTLDASVVINLNATGRAADILRMFPVPPVVTENARHELMLGASKAHADFNRLEALVRSGLCGIVPVGAGISIYESLVKGPARETLDDGEAATIAYAAASGRAAMIDERKARRICAQRFPDLTILSTVDLLLHRSIRDALGESDQADAVFGALHGARMRVPRERVEEVVARIGEARAALCPSLPGSFRGA